MYEKSPPTRRGTSAGGEAKHFATQRWLHSTTPRGPERTLAFLIQESSVFLRSASRTRRRVFLPLGFFCQGCVAALTEDTAAAMPHPPTALAPPALLRVPLLRRRQGGLALTATLDEALSEGRCHRALLGKLPTLSFAATPASSSPSLSVGASGALRSGPSGSRLCGGSSKRAVNSDVRAPSFKEKSETTQQSSGAEAEALFQKKASSAAPKKRLSLSRAAALLAGGGGLAGAVWFLSGGSSPAATSR